MLDSEPGGYSSMYRTPRIPTVDCTLRLDARSETASLRFQSQPSSDLFASGKNCRETRFQPLGHRHSAGLSPRARAKVEAADKGWKLVWHDEFDGPTLNPEYWSFDTGPWKQSGELECYTNRPENVRIEDGKLVIEAAKRSARAASIRRLGYTRRARSKRSTAESKRGSRCRRARVFGLPSGRSAQLQRR